MVSKSFLSTLGLVVTAIALMACEAPKLTVITATAIPTLTPTQLSTIEPIHYADCGWGGFAKLWRDDNRNGLHDPNEPGVGFVKVFVDDSYNKIKMVESDITDIDGKAGLSVWLPGCPEVAFEVYVIPTSAYSLTTPARIKADLNNPSQVFEFGLAYLPTTAPTPSPLGILNCTEYYYVASRTVQGAAMTPNGSLWLAADADFINRIDLRNGERIAYGQKDGVRDPHTWGVAVDPDNDVWFATSNGVLRFDGAKWRVYTKQDGLLDNSLLDVAALLDKTMWFVTYSGLSQYTPSTNSWTSYTNVTGFGQRYVSKLRLGLNGSIWLVTNNTIHHILPPETHGNRWKWVTYLDENNVGKSPMTFIADGAVASDGTLWLVGSTQNGSALVHFIPETGTWRVYDYLTTNGAMLVDRLTSVAVGKDGTIWVGSIGRGINYLIPQSKTSTEDKWVHFGAGNGLSTDQISMLYTLPSGEMLVVDGSSATVCKVASIK
jgi:streptogramin lyase